MLLDSQHIASRSRDAKRRFSLEKTAKFTMARAFFKGSWVRDLRIYRNLRYEILKEQDYDWS